MTATLTSAAEADSQERTDRPRGLLWTVTRLHRWALWVWLACVAGVAGLYLWAWGPLVDRFRSFADVTSCTGQCERDMWDALNTVEHMLRYANLALLVIPVLIGVWAAGSLIGRELESGTAALSWTQSVSPVRWLTAKLALPAVLVTGGTLVLVLLHRMAWAEYRTASKNITSTYWYSYEQYLGNGPILVARALGLLVLGVLLGLLLRRTLAAMGTALFVMGALTAVAVKYAWFFWPGTTVYGPHLRAEGLMNDSFIFSQGVVTTSGDHVDHDWSCVWQSTVGKTPKLDKDALSSCLTEHGWKDVFTTYHPKSHYWALQLSESAVWLVLAALATLVAFRVLRARTA